MPRRHASIGTPTAQVHILKVTDLTAHMFSSTLPSSSAAKPTEYQKPAMLAGGVAKPTAPTTNFGLKAVACGHNSDGQCDIPALTDGETYAHAAAGLRHTVLLKDNGQAVCCGIRANIQGIPEFPVQCEIPALAEGEAYSHVVAAIYHTVLLKDNGQAVACGANEDGQCDIPALSEGEAYSHIAAGDCHTVLLKDNGQAVACGLNSDDQCDIPALAEGEAYSHIATGYCRTILLKDNGQAVACGTNDDGSCDIPALAEGEAYSYIAAGGSHTALLKDNGQAVACGLNWDGQCDIPALAEGETYSHIAVGDYHTVLLSGQTRTRVITVAVKAFEGSSLILSCTGLDGSELCRTRCNTAARVRDVHKQIAHAVCSIGHGSMGTLKIVLPNGPRSK